MQGAWAGRTFGAVSCPSQTPRSQPDRLVTVDRGTGAHRTLRQGMRAFPMPTEDT